MPLLCREHEYDLLHQLLGGVDIESGSPKPPSVVFVHGGPQTGKKCLVSSVLKNIQNHELINRKSQKKLRIRSALLSCHLGSFGSAALFEELWRQLSFQAVQPGTFHINFKETLGLFARRIAKPRIGGGAVRDS